eukprot:scaffold29587_cov43-Prasinocladus_malaysianus.AAC.2
MAGYKIALDMGAAYVECDVAVTKDDVLVCRHSMCDLHTTTDILKGEHDDLAAKCSEPFTPATEDSPASARCCTYDFTYDELSTLCMTTDELSNSSATKASEFTQGPPSFRSNALVAKAGACEKIVRHKEMAEYLMQRGAHAIPELKDTAVETTMSYLASAGKSVEQLADKLMDELREVGYTQTMAAGSNGMGWDDPEGPKIPRCVRLCSPVSTERSISVLAQRSVASVTTTDPCAIWLQGWQRKTLGCIGLLSSVTIIFRLQSNEFPPKVSA